MADMYYSQQPRQGGHSAHEATATTPSNALKKLTNLTGAVVSLTLIAGVSVWGYKLVMRDVSGIPVVRAAAGEMRVRPTEPGGQLAQNTGLAVNEVAAEGEASGPVDRLVLAPRPMDLTDEDKPMNAAMVAPVQQPAPLDVIAALEVANAGVNTAIGAGSVEDLVNQLTAGVEPIDVQETEIVPVLASVSVADVPERAPKPKVVVKGPGPKFSIRPQLRPANAPAVVVPVAAAAPDQAAAELDPTEIPAGTRLVQLGAFDSEEIARTQWDKMQGRFGDYLKGKNRIVQQAKSGGRTFYRLRAHGFADLSDARRFCSALVAEGADCIPVVTR
jgi:sporulation related protein